jgi:hypothetical protein
LIPLQSLLPHVLFWLEEIVSGDRDFGGFADCVARILSAFRPNARGAA